MSPLNVRITAEAIDTWMAPTRSDVIIPTDKKHPPRMAGSRLERRFNACRPPYVGYSIAGNVGKRTERLHAF